MPITIAELKAKRDIVCAFCGQSEADGDFKENIKQWIAHLYLEHKQEAECIRQSLNAIVKSENGDGE